MTSFRRVVFLLIVLLLLLLFLAVPGVSLADALEDAAKSLAAKIAAKFPAGESILLLVENQSSLSEGQVGAIRRALEEQLKSRGFQSVAEKGAVPNLIVTLSQNVRGYLWIARIGPQEEHQIEMIAVPPGVPTIPVQTRELSVERTLLWAQEEPILDAAMLKDVNGSAAVMLVLDPGKLSLYGREGDHWALQNQQPIPPKGAWPRDMRGQIVTKDHFFEVHLPGLDCDGDALKTVELKCEEGQPQWSFSGGAGLEDEFALEPNRNYFGEWPSSARSFQPMLASFFSAAYVEDQNRNGTWLFSGLDDRVRSYAEGDAESNRHFQAEAVFQGWGSELAGIQARCADRWLVLATRPSDAGTPDAIQPFEVNRSTAVPAAPAAEFAGSVTALWSKEEGQSAVAVVRNLTARRYEAYRLTIACGK